MRLLHVIALGPLRFLISINFKLFASRDFCVSILYTMLYFDELLQKLYEKMFANIPWEAEILCASEIQKKKREKIVEIVVIVGIIWVYEITEVSALSQHENSFGLIY